VYDKRIDFEALKAEAEAQGEDSWEEGDDDF
jgi:hypothetical protein